MQRGGARDDADRWRAVASASLVAGAGRLFALGGGRGAHLRRRRAGARTLRPVRAASAAERTAQRRSARRTPTRCCARPVSDDDGIAGGRRALEDEGLGPKRRRRPQPDAGILPRALASDARGAGAVWIATSSGIFRGDEHGCLPAGLDGRDLLVRGRRRKHRGRGDGGPPVQTGGRSRRGRGRRRRGELHGRRGPGRTPARAGARRRRRGAGRGRRRRPGGRRRRRGGADPRPPGRRAGRLRRRGARAGRRRRLPLDARAPRRCALPIDRRSGGSPAARAGRRAGSRPASASGRRPTGRPGPSGRRPSDARSPAPPAVGARTWLAIDDALVAARPDEAGQRARPPSSAASNRRRRSRDRDAAAADGAARRTPPPLARGDGALRRRTAHARSARLGGHGAADVPARPRRPPARRPDARRGRAGPARRRAGARTDRSCDRQRRPR